MKSGESITFSRKGDRVRIYLREFASLGGKPEYTVLGDMSLWEFKHEVEAVLK